MKKLLLLTFLILLPAKLFAAGGACPTGANYAGPTPFTFNATLSSLGITGCYFVSSAGSDSNSGTSEASPWAHLPGMPSCTGNCASHVPAAGEGYILRGADRWGSANFQITWKWSGTATNPIYIGVDKSWFTGGSWNRPIWDAQQQTLGNFFYGQASWWIVDNVEMTGAFWSGTANGLAGTNGVTSCGTNTMFENSYEHGWSWTTPWANTNGPAPNNGGSSAEFEIGQGCDQGSGASVGVTMRYNILDGSDTADETAAVITQGAPIALPIAYGNYSTWGTWGALDGCGDNWHDNYSVNMGIPVNHNASASGTLTATNGSKTVTLASGGPFIGGSITIGSTNYSIASGSGSTLTLTAAFTGTSGTNSFSQGASFHQNGFKHLGACNSSNIFSYNNVVIHQVAWNGDGGDVKYWFSGACGSYTMYAFNDVIADTGNGNVTDFGSQQHAVCSSGTLFLFNSTFECGRDNASGGCTYGNGQPSGATLTGNFSNIHWIGAGTTICEALCPSGGYSFAETGPLYQTVAQANTQGYTSGSTYAFQPTLGSGGTVGTGGNNQSLCSTIATLDAFAGSSCRGDTSYGVVYNSSTHTLSFPAKIVNTRPGNGNWDKGAYQFLGGQISPPQPSLTCNGSNSFNFGNVLVGQNGLATCTLTNSGSTTLNVSFTPAPAAPFSIVAGTSCGTTLNGGQSCTVPVQFAPTAMQSYAGTLTETDSINNVSATEALSGTGINPAAATLAPSPVAFGNQAQGTTSSPITVTLTNSGGAPLTLGTPFSSITGNNASDFALVAASAPTWTIDQFAIGACTPASGGSGGGTATCTNTALGSNITAGHSLLALDLAYIGITGVTVTKPTKNATSGDGDTWTECPASVLQYFNFSKQWYVTDCSWVPFAAGGSKTATNSFTYESKTTGVFINQDIALFEFHPSSGTTSIDNGYSTNSASCSPCTGPTLSITGTSDVVFPWAAQFNVITALNAPYTLKGTDAGTGGGFGDAVNQSSVTTPSWTTGTASQSVMAALAFNASTISNACGAGQVLQAGSSCNLQLTFTPITTNGESATLTVNGNSGAVTGSVVLSGAGTGPPQTATPTFSPVGGTFTSTQTPSITSLTSGAMIIYTTDGSQPGTNTGTCTANGTGTAISNGATITVSTSETVNAIACHSGDTNSGIATAIYVIQAQQTTVALPTASLASGSWVGSQSNTLSSGTTGSSILYTTDGTTPTDNGSCGATGTSTAVSTGSSITISTSGTLKFYGCKSGSLNSAIVSQTYSIYAGAPTFSPNGGLFPGATTFNVTVTSPTGSNICYTTDLSNPLGVNGTCSHGTQISSGSTISVTLPEVVFAVATQSGYLTSGLAGAVYTPFVPAPAVAFAGLKIYGDFETATAYAFNDFLMLP